MPGGKGEKGKGEQGKRKKIHHRDTEDTEKCCKK
jgi:hypothetical protein